MTRNPINIIDVDRSRSARGLRRRARALAVALLAVATCDGETIGVILAADAGSSAAPKPSYFDLIGIGWSDDVGGGPRFVWRPQLSGIDPSESMRIFKYLEGPDIDLCLAAIIDSDPALRSELAEMGAGTACGGTPEALERTRALWTSYGFGDALAEVAHLGRRAEKVAEFLSRCAALQERAKTSSESRPVP